MPEGPRAATRDGWPRAPVVYEIYPRSFRDSTGSGEGDLNGITAGLDHVARLGVDAIWLAPFYASPMTDGGYDITDHRAVDPRFGTIDDFDRLVRRAHDLGLLVMVDQVLAHTSMWHPWFRAALAGDAAMARRYVWRDPKPDGTAPNNWMSFFGPPAWTWDHRREQYYHHQFLACQPALNLRNPEVQAEHAKTMAFWRDRGVDGFRCDAVSCYLYDESLRDNPAASPEVRARVTGPSFNPYTYQDHSYDMLPGDGGAFMEVVRGWAGPDMWLLGECNSGNQSIELALAFTEKGRLNASYTTDLQEQCRSLDTILDVLGRIDGQHARVPWWLSSHDQPRHGTAMGDGSDASARFHALLLGCLPGPLILYQGEELGLPQPKLTHDETTDPFDLLYWPDPPGREGPRVPIPWADRGPGFGFTDGTPWLPMRWEPRRSIAVQDAASDSVLAFYRRVLDWRRSAGSGDVQGFAASRDGTTLRLDWRGGDATWLALLNFGADPVAPEAMPNAAATIASQPVDGALPASSGAVWRRDG